MLIILILSALVVALGHSYVTAGLRATRVAKGISHDTRVSATAERAEVAVPAASAAAIAVMAQDTMHGAQARATEAAGLTYNVPEENMDELLEVLEALSV